MKCRTCGGPLIAFEGPEETPTVTGADPRCNHDDSCHIYTYLCGLGHKTYLSLRRQCPNPDCNWKGMSDCWCHVGEKIEGKPEDLLHK